MKTFYIILLISLFAGIAAAQTVHPNVNGIGIGSRPIVTIASTDGALALWGNPAALGVNEGVGFFWFKPTDDKDYNRNTAIGVHGGGLAWSGEYLNEVPNGAIQPRIFNWGMGTELSDGFFAGFRYQYSKGFDQQNMWSFGILARPYSWISIGAVARNTNEARVGDTKTKTAFDAGIGFRPLALTSWKHGHRITVGVDASYYEQDSIKYGDKFDPRVYVEVEPIDGLKLQAQYASDPKEVRVGVGLTANHLQLGHSVRSGDDNDKGGVSSVIFESDGLMSLPVHNEKKIIRMKMPVVLDEQEGPFSFFSSRNPELEKFLKKIRRMTNDPEVKGLILDVTGVGYGSAKMQEILRELDKFKAAGKKLYVYSKELSNGGYLLASEADKVYLHPQGYLELLGYASPGLYLRGTLDKLGVEMEVEASGPHKTAPNMFTEKHMTDEDREQRMWLVGDLYRQFTERIAQNRGWSVDTVKQKIDDGPYNANEAVAAKLIDGTMYPDEVEKKFTELYTGKTEKSNSAKFMLFSFNTNPGPKVVSATKYFMEPEIDPRWDHPMEPKIAVIYAVGSIDDGASGSSLLSGRTMGSETMVRAIHNARTNPHVKAIVLRIDSPGGSGFASDEMWRELMLCKEDTENVKPVIVSMSDVAASGGYYIATPAETVVAEPGTITGSIGVFSMRPVIDSTLQKIGTNYEQIKFGKHANMNNIFKKNTPEERAIMEREIKYFYHNFVQKVADSRKMKWDAVDTIANGRVWTGMQGRKNGLVDTLGGLDLALQIAKAKAGIVANEKPDILVYPKPMGMRLAIEMQNAMMSVLPEPMKEAVRTSNTIANSKASNMMLVAPDWVHDIVTDESAKK